MTANDIKILVADDSRTISMMLQSVLSQEGYVVETAFDGLEAMEKVYQTLPDLIVLDILMPKMNGYQVCRLLKDDAQTASIPIIMLSAKSEQKDKFWGLQTGADKYLTKSKEIAKTLLAEIKTIFQTQREGRKARPMSLPSFNRDELIQRLNNVLDDMLFHSILVNEIQEKSEAISDFVVLNQKLLTLLGQVIHFHLGVVYFFEGDSGTIVAYLPSTALSAKHIIEQLEDAFKKRKLRGPLPQNLLDFTFQVFPEPPPKVEEVEPSDQLIETISIRGTLRGVLLLQRYDGQVFSEEEQKTLRFYLKHATQVLDIALLYHKTQQLAITDGLTQLYNHRYFQDSLKDELNRARRFRRPLSLLMVDIDHFKHFNDTFGHQEGDNILKELAQILNKNVRSIEIVARYGGEEFTIIMPETDESEGRKIAERLRRIVAKHRFPLSKEHPQEKITVSIGVATFPPSADTQVELIRCADKALYAAKEAGRNCVAFDGGPKSSETKNK